VKSIVGRTPSPALVISLIALFVSLGGVSWAVATGSIDSREIKDNTIRSRDIRNNTIRSFDIRNNEVRGRDIRNSTIQGRDVAFDTLTGADIDEPTLAKVPQAAQSDSAQDAVTVTGLAVKKIFAKQPTGTGPAEILRGDGFSLKAGCSAGGTVSLQLDGVAGVSANASAEGDSSGGAVFVSDAGLQPGDNLDLLAGAQSGAGTAVVATTAGSVTTIAYGAHSANAFTGEPVCAVSGTAITG
jgi:hypothetical protein